MQKTIKQLKDEYIELYKSIHQVGCCGVKDTIELEKLEGELYNRGFEVNVKEKIVFSKR